MECGGRAKRGVGMMRKIVELFRRKVFRKNGRGISFVMRLVEGALDAYDISYEVVAVWNTLVWTDDVLG